ncbi:MAG: DUF4911 domain-containing protein [Dissulfurimicrobium sp.]|uniref:DUF4911 domain-containing protein n=1 Tax=Dissulfurimicrobium TaxID=1769732 RepID=UPI001EDBB21B|nr:DUF4911 domain-containing protein [Dissulfurimicrobium hydrothermale]UKL13466.1 DUF4911 domain-containing protein [Dissulfurimicrobium hydrothermale]
MDGLNEFILRIEPSMVYLLRFILEGYDNSFMVSTVDKAAGVVRIIAIEGAKEDLFEILMSLSWRLRPFAVGSIQQNSYESHDCKD